MQPEGKVTEITRDVFGKPTRLRQRNAAGTQVMDRHYVYDVHQQLCKSIEPETGATVMDYDVAGNLVWSASGLHGGNYPSTATCSRSEASGSGRSIGRAYDTRNRIVGLWTPDGRGNQSWQYTPDGLVSQLVVDNDGPATATVINAYSYNRRRLLTGESQSQPGWYTWALGYGYNANGHRVYTHYPDGFHSTRHVNALDQETLVESSWGVLASNIAWHPNGTIKSFTYGNGIVHETQLNARQLPSRRSDAGITNTGTVYDANGNPQAIHDDLRGSAFSRWMQYDGLDRLTAAGSASFGGDHWHRFGYDALDNLTHWTLAGVKDHAQYVYDGNHRLTNIRNGTGASVIGLSYDAQGNLAHKNGQDYHFDYRNRLKEASGQEYYRYDGHGRRVLGWRPGSGSILAMYTNDGHLLFQYDERRSYSIPHVYLGGRLLARMEWSWLGAAGSGIHYQHTDALGSPTATTNAAGQLVERIDYEPFGAMIGKANDDKPRYTGHVMDSATGLTYMQQRYYDPGIGRFLSVDPVTAYGGDARHFSRYAYAYNNPYLFVDPDGRAGCADNVDQKLTRTCIHASSFNAESAKLVNVVSTRWVDNAIRGHAIEKNQVDGNEAVIRADTASSVAIGNSSVDLVRLSPVATTAATPDSADFPFSSVRGATAVAHSHPTTHNTIVPGVGDYDLVRRGIPNYIMHGTRALVVEISGGQYRARVISGALTGSERRLVRQRLNQFQSMPGG